MDQEQQKEFEEFEIIQGKIARAFSGHPDALDLGFLIAQALRDVPSMFRMLADFENHSLDDIQDAIQNVVVNHFALTEANKIL